MQKIFFPKSEIRISTPPLRRWMQRQFNRRSTLIYGDTFQIGKVAFEIRKYMNLVNTQKHTKP